MDALDQAMEKVREWASRIPLPPGVKGDHLLIGALSLVILCALIGIIAGLAGGSNRQDAGSVKLLCNACGHLEQREAVDISQKQLAGEYAPRPMDCPECDRKECLFFAVTCAACGQVYIPAENLHWKEPTDEGGGCPNCEAEDGRTPGQRPALRK